MGGNGQITGGTPAPQTATDWTHWHTAAATVGGLVGAVAATLLAANSVDVVTHWLTTIGGVAGAIAVAAGAVVAALRARKSG